MNEKAVKTEPPSFVSSPEFLARKKRIEDAMVLKKPDRVPIAPAVVHYYPTKAKGISNREAQYNIKKTLEVWKETIIMHNWDAATPFGSIAPSKPLDILSLQQIRWPGAGLPDDRPFQWVEGEYMMQDEYDEVLDNPTGFAIKKLWPRIASTLAPISKIAQAPPPAVLFLSSAYTLPGFLGDMVSSPEMIGLLEKTLELAKETNLNNKIAAEYSVEMMNLGYPLLLGGFTFTAFDWISDTLRGMRGVMIDMYQVPDKLLALIDMYIPLTIGLTAAMAKEAGIKRVMIPLHRGSAGFMSVAHYAKFYWPSLKALVLGLIDAGITPVVFIEGDYTPRLIFLQELPPKKAVLHFDQVDRKKAKEMIGDIACFWGNVPASIMCTGKPNQVKDDVKELIDLFGDNGGLIIDSTVGIPDESKVENVQALTDAVHEFGIY